jgi:hypothetical protein
VTGGPEFDDLVGDELESGERDRLRRVHELLVAAGPPPELPPELERPPEPANVTQLRRRRGALVAIAAALCVLAFAVGFLAGARPDDGTFDTISMRGTPAAEGAWATIEIFDADAAGNWPMEIEVGGLAPAPDGALYQLWLAREGRLVALCGSFLADPDGTTIVPMNAPWRLSEFDSWIVVEEGSRAPLLST